MPWATGISRYEGRCHRCGQSYPVGTMVRFGGTGKKYHTYHLKEDCPGKPVATTVSAQAKEHEEIHSCACARA